MRRFNLFSGPLSQDEDDPPGYRGWYSRVGTELGADKLAVNLFVLEPGQSLCPYHYEYTEEWLVVLEGRPTIRHPDGEEILEQGDAVCFPSGPSGAHQVTNNDRQNTRLIMFSTAAEPAVAVYPDSDKIGVWPGSDQDKIIVRRESAVDYWDGEHDGKQ